MGRIVLNPSQQRYLRASLEIFEESLREASRLLEDTGEEKGILYFYKLRLDAANRQLLREKIAGTLKELASFALQLELKPREVDSARIIMANMSVSWENLIDSLSDRMRRYGELSPEAVERIDPSLSHLAQIALEIAKITSMNNPEENPDEE